MFGKFGMLGWAAVLLAVAGCATQDAYDIRPDENDGVPTAVEWQNAHDREIAAATQPEELSACVKTAEAADALLVQVRSAYETDPLVATKVAAVTQFVMASDPVGRAVWRKALLGAAGKSSEAYRTMFFLEQIRWCGAVDDVEAVEKISASSRCEKVREFCSVVVRELTVNQRLD